MIRNAVLCLLIFYFIPIYCGVFQGTPNVKVTEMVPCKEYPNQAIKTYVEVENYNRSVQLLSGNLTFPEDFDKSYKVRAVIYRKINGAWKKDLQIEKGDPCNYLRLLLGPLYLKLIREAHASQTCPIKAGFYHVEKFIFETNVIPIIYATGLFKLEGYLLRNNVVKCCYEIYATITLEKGY